MALICLLCPQLNGMQWCPTALFASILSRSIHSPSRTPRWWVKPGMKNQTNPTKSISIKPEMIQKVNCFGNQCLEWQRSLTRLMFCRLKPPEYEKICLRIYWHFTYNWTHAPDVDVFRDNFKNRDGDIFETVETYFKICRKYHVPTYEQPYYFLSNERKRDIKLEGDMLKRTGSYNENEIRISILEGIP